MGKSDAWAKVSLALRVGDIVVDYLQAKSPKKMLQALADQCETKPARIKWVLWQCGVPVKLTGAGPSIEAYGDLWMEMDGAACAAVREKMIEWNGGATVEENMENAEKSATVEPIVRVQVQKVEFPPQEEPVGRPGWEKIPEREELLQPDPEAKCSGWQASTADFVVSMLWDYYLDQRGIAGITAEMVERMRRLMVIGDQIAEIMEGDL